MFGLLGNLYRLWGGQKDDEFNSDNSHFTVGHKVSGLLILMLVWHCTEKKTMKKGKKHSRLIACQYKWKLITWISEITSWWFSVG